MDVERLRSALVAMSGLNSKHEAIETVLDAFREMVLVEVELLRKVTILEKGIESAMLDKAVGVR